MRLTPRGGAPFDDAAQFYWRVERLPERAAASVTFPARADGEWHEHTLALGQCAHWRRTVTALRIDPCNRGDVDVSIDWVRLLPARSTAPSAP